MSAFFSPSHPLPRLILAAAIFCCATAFAGAAEWYVAPTGTAQGKGDKDAPWDIESALAGKHQVQPGDTIFLRAGTYKRRPDEKFIVRLVGAAGKPIHVRPVAKERVTIDGGIAVEKPSAHVWIWDLEIIVSEPQPTKPVSAGSHPVDFTRPWGGLHLMGGNNCKCINLVIHECRQGVSAWSGSVDSEIHGCIIYDNGWPAVDRGHGHAIYTQNKDGVNAITDCIMTGGHGYTVHAYGSKQAFVDNYLIEGNIIYNANTFLVGGGKPSKNIRVLNNFLYGVSMQLGYTAPSNEDCEVRDNLIVNGGLTINKYKKAVNEGNVILAKNAARPQGERVIIRPNKYDPRRANLAIFNWAKEPLVDVDLSGFLKKGDSYRLMRPKNIFGGPTLSATYSGGFVRVPVQGEFAAFVVLKD